MDILTNLSPFQWALIVGAAVVLLLIWKGGDLAAWWNTKKATTVDGAHPRLVVLAKLDEAYDYFQAERCPEGMAAIRTALQHVYHDHPPEAARNA